MRTSLHCNEVCNADKEKRFLAVLVLVGLMRVDLSRGIL